MGLFGRVFGGKPKDDKGSDAAATASTSAPAASTQSVASTGPAAPPGHDLVRDVSPESQLLKTLSMEMPSVSGGPGGTRVYNPYEGLTAAVGAKPHAFKLPSGPEFVFEEEAAVRRRGWTENLQFYTGLGYLLGGTLGVGSGLYQYITVKPEITTDSYKLKTNRLLNTCGSYARPMSNGAGILGMFFSITESVLINNLEQQGVPDAACTALAGFAAGALFRAPRGPRQAVVAGAVGVVAGAGIVGLRKVFPSL